MELTILEAKNAPDKPVVAVCMGTVRRQVRMEVNRPFQIPDPGADEKGVQVTVFQQLTSQAMPLLSNTGKKEEVACHIPVQSLTGSASEVKLRVRRCGDGGGSPLEPVKPAKAAGDTSLDDAKKYLDHHGLQQRIQDLIQDVLREQPDEPYKYMLQNLKSNKGSQAPRPQQPKEAAMEEVLQKATAPLVPKPPSKPCPTNASPRKAQNIMAAAARKTSRDETLAAEAKPSKEEAMKQARVVVRMALQGRGGAAQGERDADIRAQARASIREVLLRFSSSSIVSVKNAPEHQEMVRCAAALAYRGAAKVIESDPVRRQECFR